MCGIAGLLSKDPMNQDEMSAVVSSMAAALTHRGPDGEGYWFDPRMQVAFGHRRLAILDLSDLGKQPMESERYCIVLNGEIYNFRDLKEELEKKSNEFKGNSDTEVLLRAFEEWGVEKALQKTVGMFALALWDKKERRLYLARDRIGEKPLYCGTVGNVFAFASELKPFRSLPSWNPEVDRDVLSSFLKFGYVPTPFSIYKGVRKLKPGAFITVNLNNLSDLHETIYWSAASLGGLKKFDCEGAEIAASLEAQLLSSIQMQMISDVPLGAFLSGGIDSSLVVALMQRQSKNPIKTFSIGFESKDFDEAPFAREVARHLGTDHTELYISPRDALDLVPTLAKIYDEPFADSSQIPTTILSRLTRQYVTVSLSGDGGDELFGGYPHYQTVDRVWKMIRWMPPAMRRAFCHSLSPSMLDFLEPLVKKVIGKENIKANLSEKIPQIKNILGSADLRTLYYRLFYQWDEERDLVLGSEAVASLDTPQISVGAQELMMFEDLMHYLPDDILTKVDRASMSAGLESRAPFLDHRVVEFAWRTPLSMKIRKRKGKWVLRKILSKYVPEKIFERPKQGFRTPIDQWLKSELRCWAEDLLDENRIKRQGYFNPQRVQRIWRGHLEGKGDYSSQVWNLLMFQAWL